MAAETVVDGLPFTEDKKRYIVDVLDPLLEEMIAEVVTELPGDPLEFMIEWLQKRSGVHGHNRQSVVAKNIKLKQELKQTRELLQEAAAISGEASEAAAVAEEEEENDDLDDDCGDELPESFKKSEASLGKVRTSVSAEAYGVWNQKKEFTPPSYAKTQDQKERLKNTLLKSFMFVALDQKDLEIILLAMKEVPLTPGSQVIKEGEDGDFLFVIETGTLDCIKVINGEETVVKQCCPGDVFGELALLYNCPRAASVVAKDNCVCWQLDRETFNHVVKAAAVKRRDKYDQFLKSVTLIESLGAYERSQIADALKQEVFNRGEVIVKQDDPGDKFYILEEGSLYAMKETADGSQKRVMDYVPGDYFGELALLQNQPRAASVVVQSETALVLSMSRAAFGKMLGPLQGILSRSAANYT